MTMCPVMLLPQGQTQIRGGANYNWRDYDRGAPKNKKFKQSDNVVKYSPQEILRRSLGNSGKNN